MPSSSIIYLYAFVDSAWMREAGRKPWRQAALAAAKSSLGVAAPESEKAGSPGRSFAG